MSILTLLMLDKCTVVGIGVSIVHVVRLSDGITAVWFEVALWSTKVTGMARIEIT